MSIKIPCIKRDKSQISLKKKQQKLVKYKKECDDLTYNKFQKYMKDDTLKSLLIGLYNYYKEKKIDKNFILTFEDFVNMFPRDSSTIDFNFKKQHVFEALCKILLCLNYDRDLWGEGKIFYRSLESYTKGDHKELKKEVIFEQKINEGSDAGSVDIFFKIGIKKKGEKNKICSICESSEKDEVTKEKFILIQNKFYTKEYSSADKYDVTKILSRASPLATDQFGNSEIKLILMVNNKEELLCKISKIKNDDFSLVPKENIFGCKEINDMFNELLYDIMNSNSVDDILNIEKESRYDTIQLRFHQKFFINVSIKYLEEGYKKFIWGAVPRSGKSYMIGGLIKERKENNIIIFLGAKNETECQFVEMFCKYTEFDDYGIIVSTPRSYKSGFKKINEAKDKNIFIFSQELIKVNEIKDENSRFWKKYRHMFGKRHLDIYFDEIHKGGTTETSQEKIINALTHNGFVIDMFTMVTATYAKPTIAYKNIINDKLPIIINWSYEDQQNMKKISSETIKGQLLDSRNEIQQNEIKKLFDDYEELYHDQYLKILEDDYSISPELILLRGIKDGSEIDISRDLNLKCSANPYTEKKEYETKEEYINKKTQNYYDPYSIFENAGQVIRLIDSIAHYSDDILPKLPKNTIYGDLYYNYKYPIDKPHTQIWFLPYQHLYKSSDETGIPCTSTQKIAEETGEEEEIDKTGLPNIEPLIRGLISILIRNIYFKEHFCFLAVYGGNRVPDFYNKLDNLKEDCITKKVHNDINKSECVTFSSHDKKRSIKQIIHECENKAYKQNKSLIVLTGAMLRLGISVANADIALNFDRNKSIDLNYQTMFRVLTERTGKRYGYYYDFYPERCQRFIYDYNTYYTNFNGRDNDKKDKINKIQALLYLFKYDGLGVIQTNTIEQIQLYNKLIQELNINEETYNTYYRSNPLKIITGILSNITIDDTLIDDIKRYRLNLHSEDITKPKIKITLKEGIHNKTKKNTNNENNNGNDNYQKNEDDPININDIALYINDYTNIIALFSREYKCFNIDDCIKKIHNLSKETLCECNTSQMNVLGCYMRRIKGYDLKTFLRSIKIYKKIINSDDRIKNEIINIFDSISDKMGRTNKIIKNMDSAEIQKMIEEYLPVRKIEKDKYGEVFTPLELIDEILNQLPPTIWKKKELKWLEPANGTGNFMMVVYKRLMNGLTKQIKDEKERSEHILKNMLYMVEINEKNVAVSRKVFGEKNVLCSDFLETDVLKIFKVVGFDVIIGNPPFNSERTEADKRQGGHGNKKIWDKFIIKTLDLLNTNGYLGFITPSSWRAPPNAGETIYDLMTKDNYLKYLHIYSKKDGQSLFNVSQRFDTYVIQKENEGTTNIIDEKGNKHNIDVKILPFIPNYEFDNIQKILSSNGIDVIYDSTFYHTQNKKKNMNKTKTKEFKFPVVHSVNQDGIVLWYSNKNNGHFGVPKVILNKNEKQYNWPEQNDSEGKYGMSQVSFGIPITSKKEGEQILNCINSDVFKEIIQATKWGIFETDYKMFKYFKKDFYKKLTYKGSKNKTRKN